MTNKLYLAELANEITNVVEVHESNLASTEGGGIREVPEGTALAVLTGYVETGEHKNKNGVSKAKGFMEFMLFDVEGEEPKYTRKVKDDEGNEITVGTMLTHRFSNISRNEKAHFRKDVDAMFLAAGIVDQSSPIKLLTKTVLVDVVHNKSEDGKTTYTNLELEVCKAPYACDNLGKPVMTKPLSLPVKTSELPLKLFVWSAPTPLQWSTIEIEGTYKTKNDKGVEVEKSKNWIQELIKKADNFLNSPIESMIIQSGNTGTPLPKATKSKKTTPKAVPSDRAVEPTPVAQEVVVDAPAVGLTDKEEGQLVQYEQMIKMCEDSGSDGTQFVTLRDALIAKRDGK